MPRRWPPKPWEGKGQMPIYRHEMTSLSWQLLWWFCVRMDANGMVFGGWRTHAAADIGRHRISIMRAGNSLLECGLIDTKPRARSLKVNVAQFTG